MANFVSEANASELMDAIGTKKLTVTDIMPTASAGNVGIPYLYLGATTQNYSNGSIYKCQEVTPATDPKTYEYVEIYVSNVDLSKYKRIWGGTEAAWDLLTDEEKAQYEYMFFDGDSADYFAVVDAVTNGDMHPVTSNAVYDSLEPLRQNTTGKFELPNGLKICWGNLGSWSGGSIGSGYRTATYPITFTNKPIVMLTVKAPKTSMEKYVYCANYDESESSTTQLCCSPVWWDRTSPTSYGFSNDNYQYIAIGY